MSGSRQSISSRFQISGDSGKPLHNNNGMASPSRGNDSVLRVVGSSHSGHVCHIPQHSAPPVHVSSTGATNIGRDALSQHWQGQSLYKFSPFPLLNKVIQKLRATQKGEIILIPPGGRLSRGFLI